LPQSDPSADDPDLPQFSSATGSGAPVCRDAQQDKGKNGKEFTLLLKKQNGVLTDSGTLNI
jgi:hypothetical protein